MALDDRRLVHLYYSQAYSIAVGDYKIYSLFNFNYK